MSNKTLNARVVQKHDIEENWLKATNFTPKAGEIIIYDADVNNPLPRIKIGDGVSNVNDLEFVGATPDWKANEGEEGYIENRTHFLYPREMVEVYSEFTATFTDSRYTLTSAPNAFPLAKSDICSVIWNGVTYGDIRPDIHNIAGTHIKGCFLSTAAFDIELYQELYEFGRTGDMHSSYGQIYAKDGSSSATIIITCNIAIPKKLDERYLPDVEYSPIMRGFDTPSAAWGGILANPRSNGEYSFAYGAGVEAGGSGSVAFGMNTSAGHHAMAVGYNTAANEGSFASGMNTKARGYASHTEGENTEASGLWSHAEGSSSKALGRATHAEGEYTIARGEHQHVQGSCNIEDLNNNYIHIVGNGFCGGTEDSIVRSNAHTLDWSGNAWFSGDVYVGSTSGTNKDEGSQKLVTMAELQAAIPDSTEIVAITTDEINEICGTVLYTENAEVL